MRIPQILGLVGLLLAGVTGCDDDEEVETEGLLTFGFYGQGSISSFLPCGHQEAWWVVAPEELTQRYAGLQIGPGESAYARLRGDRSDRGHYGNLDAYRYEFEVRDVVALRRADPRDCR